MIIDLKCFCAYTCPICLDSSMHEINIFQISNNKVLRLSCQNDDCREHCISITSQNTKNFRIEMYCPICGEPHSYTIKKDYFWQKPIINLKCSTSGIDAAFIGKNEKLKAALKNQHKILSEISSDREIDMSMEIIMAIVDRLNILQKSNNLYCECGSHKLTTYIGDNDSITLKCENCGNFKELQITPQTVSELLNAQKIVLNNN